MNWSDVGSWLKTNAGTGTALIGSLLTGNVHGAIAAGVSLVSSATGQSDPQKALEIVGTLMEAEVYEGKYHGDSKGTTYHVFEQDGDAISIEMMPNNKYNLCKLAGKPEGN